MDQRRILTLQTTEKKGDSVVYIMSRDQRVADNHALLAAQEKAVELGVGLAVVFNFISPNGVRAYEHAEFMLAGLKDVSDKLATLSIPFIMTSDTGPKTLETAIKTLNPTALYFDFSPLKGPRALAKKLAKSTGISTYIVDTHNIIPAWVASDKQEFAAHTFRRKVHRLLEQYVLEPGKPVKHPHTISETPTSMTFADAKKFIESYPKRSITIAFEPGEKAAHKRLNTFIEQHLESYALQRNNIVEDHQSGLSPYFHFGQLSSLRVALEVLQHVNEPPLLFNEARMASPGTIRSAQDGMNALFEEMIVRKELSDNFCLFATNYKTLDSVPNWAVTTLRKHQDDMREFTYTAEELERGQTHDEIWNASQKELTTTGKLHGYLRMYWAKKVLEWSKTPQEALATTIYLNDAYSIDGGDPNGYVGVLWSIAGLHDRPWTERPIFGMIRYMNAAGLRRKFKVDAYIDRVTREVKDLRAT